MKNTKIFLMGLALCGLAASCQQDPGDLGKMQSNPQEEIIQGTDGVNLTLASAIDGKTVDIAYYLSINGVAFVVPTFNVTLDERFADAGMSYTLQVASLADYSDAVEVELYDNTDEGADVSEIAMFPSSLQSAFQKLYSKFEVNVRQLYMRVAVFAEFGKTKVRVGGVDYWFFSGKTISVLPDKIPGLMVGTPGADGKDLNASMKLQRNLDDDAPKFQYAGFVVINNPYTIEQIGLDNFKLGFVSEGNLSATSTTPIPVPVDGAGMYYVVITSSDGAAFTYSATKITAVGCIGEFNGWGGDAALTSNADGTVWTGDVDFAAAGGWKFRMNGGWDISLGGEANSLYPFNGSNMMLENTGVYTVTLDISNLPYTCTLVKK